MQVLQHLLLLWQHVNAISFQKPYCMGSNTHENSRHCFKQQVSLFFMVLELGDKKFHGWSTVMGEIFSFPFLFHPPQTSSKEYVAFSRQNVPIAFNCTFQQIYQLLLCHLLARGQSVKGGWLSEVCSVGLNSLWGWWCLTHGLFDYSPAQSKGHIFDPQ